MHLHPKFPARGTPQEQEMFAVKYNATMTRIHADNEEARRIKEQIRTKRFLGPVAQVNKLVCQAVNMNNSPCKFKATCGRFCKKHKITAKDLELLE